MDFVVRYDGAGQFWLRRGNSPWQIVGRTTFGPLALDHLNVKSLQNYLSKYLASIEDVSQIIGNRAGLSPTAPVAPDEEITFYSS
jgi:hypothetical protein